jgi:CHASE3 domain sensor protein
MPNKKLLILFCIALIILLSAIIFSYQRTQKEAKAEEAKKAEEAAIMAEGLMYEEELEMISETESNFYILAGKFFELGDDVITNSEVEFFEIERKITEAKEDIKNKLVTEELIHANIEKINEEIKVFEEKIFGAEE